MHFTATIFLSLGLCLVTATASFADVRVVDGDTLEIAGATYRINGIDAPEYGQKCASRTGGTWACGKEAVTALVGYVFGKDVRCDNIAYSGASAHPFRQHAPTYSGVFAHL